jgi:soluble lytic murein transglycosylase-like protein
MIHEMYDIMREISDIQKRFGLVKEVQVNKQKAQKTDANSFDLQVQQKIEAGKIAGNSRAYIDSVVTRYAHKNKISEDLLRSVIEVESRYNPNAVSTKGAKGLMQLMPSVVKDYKVSNPFSVEENIRAGSGLLKSLLDHYNGDYKKALAAYNAGQVPVDRVNGVPDYRETKAYVQKVISLYQKNQ